MGITTGAKHKLYFGAAAPATFDQAGWAAVTGWELAPCPETLPELIKRLETVTFSCLHSGTTETARGVAEAITFNPPFKDEPANAAQTLLKSAFDAAGGSAAELVSMKIENADASQIIYAQAKVMAWGPGERAVGSVFLRVIELSIDAATVVEV